MCVTVLYSLQIFRFDETRKEKDMRLLAQNLVDGEKEWFANQHEDPRIFKVTFFQLRNFEITLKSLKCLIQQTT